MRISYWSSDVCSSDLKDKTDRKSLVAKGNEDRARRHEQVSLAVDAKRQLVDQAKRRHQALLHLQDDVRDFRTRQAPSLLADMKQEREHAGLSATDWEAFRQIGRAHV